MHRSLALTVGLLAVAALNAAPARGQTDTAAADASPPAYYALVLDRAMYAGNNVDDARELVLDLARYGDDWGAVYGVSRRYNMPFHKGAVHDATITDDAITLKIDTVITPDKWIPGGQGDYTVELKREGDTLVGTFTGEFNGKKVAGTATGSVYEPTPFEGYRPLEPQEHPRILFRKHELPALREKLSTPFGQAALKAMEAHGTPSALGALYQLTGDKSWAVKAEREAELYLSGKKPRGDPFVPKRPLWGRLEELALVYDLCYDALSDDFKARYRAWVSNFAFQAYFAPESLGTTNWHVVSNHVANVYSGLTHAGLALFDEPAPKPAPPSAPHLEPKVAPAEGYKPGDGVPVVELDPAASPTEWLHVEPLWQATPDDPREVFYGLDEVHPEPGTTVKVGDFALTFQKMNEQFRSDDPIGGLEIESLLAPFANAKAQLSKPFTTVLYTVLKVDEPGTYTVFNPSSRANLSQMSLAGKLVAHGQVVELEPGLYPLMAMAQWRMKWGHFAPGLRATRPGDAEAWATLAEQLRGKYETRKSAYDTVLENWARTGGGDPAFARLMRLARFTSVLHCTHAVGRGGFQGEVGHYSLDAMSGHAKLWPAYRRVLGYDLDPGFQYPDYIPRKLVGGPQDINGTTQIPGAFFAALFPVVRDAYKPDVLQAWLNKAEAADPSNPVELLKEDPVRAFLSAPLDMTPQPVGTNLPLAWEAPDFGYFVLRSGWGKDAFIGQVFLKSMLISGWSGGNAGTYRLRGLGQNWATGTGDRVRNRQNENVVWIPADLDDGARGHLTHLDIDPKAGTMVVSADLSELYERKGVYWLTKYGHLRLRVASPGKKGEELPEPSGITGMRSIAFDYSGMAGAPCLFAIVDRIDGGDDLTRNWLFQPPIDSDQKPKQGEPSPLEQAVAVGENGFVVEPATAKATLRGVFAHPAEAEVSRTPIVRTITKNWGKQRGKELTYRINAVTVPGQDHFFFVGTVVDGDASAHPEVKVKGNGLDAVVTIGGRTVHFDGEKIVLGQAD